MSLVAVPSSSPSASERRALPSVGRRRTIWLFALAAVLVIGGALWALSRGGSASAADSSSGSGSGAPGAWYSVVPMDLEVKIVKDGELAAVNAIDIICQVEGST